jgi:hypothetical protein
MHGRNTLFDTIADRLYSRFAQRHRELLRFQEAYPTVTMQSLCQMSRARHPYVRLRLRLGDLFNCIGRLTLRLDSRSPAQRIPRPWRIDPAIPPPRLAERGAGMIQGGPFVTLERYHAQHAGLPWRPHSRARGLPETAGGAASAYTHSPLSGERHLLSDKAQTKAYSFS